MRWAGPRQNARSVQRLSPSPGQRSERRVVLTAEEIVRAARDLGDENPLHYDAELAAASRFGGLIASASHTIGLLLGLAGSQTSPDRPGVGLGFAFELKRAARAGDELVVWWEIDRVEATPGGSSTLVYLNGGIDLASGEPILTATGKTLFFIRPQ